LKNLNHSSSSDKANSVHSYEIDPNELKMEKEIGEGAYGVVFKAK